ncbi:MAG: hypothetical protein IAE82_21710 [Opitutaceae bacterium]|nr:hypothetical protein [Opitutaceae bacterium]
MNTIRNLALLSGCVVTKPGAALTLSFDYQAQIINVSSSAPAAWRAAMKGNSSFVVTGCIQFEAPPLIEIPDNPPVSVEQPLGRALASLSGPKISESFSGPAYYAVSVDDDGRYATVGWRFPGLLFSFRVDLKDRTKYGVVSTFPPTEPNLFRDKGGSVFAYTDLGLSVSLRSIGFQS